MARINLSVPDSLRKEMDEFCPGMNWSEVFQDAVECNIAIQKVILRLRESKRKYHATVPHHPV